MTTTYSQAYALAAKNARACEEAAKPDCTCACGGRYHGTAHPGVFVAEYAAQLYATSEQGRQQLELLEGAA